MSRAPARFRQLDVARALKGARDADMVPKRLEIDAYGKIVLAFTEVAPADAVAAEEANPWDEAV